MRIYFRPKKGLEEGMYSLFVYAHTQTRSRLGFNTRSKVITKTFDQFDPPACCLVTCTGKKEALEREQIACTLKVKVMRSLFSKDI